MPIAVGHAQEDSCDISWGVQSQTCKRRSLSDDHGQAVADGSERFLVDEPTLLAWTKTLGGTLADPLKTTNVHNMRCMTTWVMERG